jgi:hypothetical protein
MNAVPRLAPLLTLKCAVKGACLQRMHLPPGNWFAPPVNNAEARAERVLGVLANRLKCTGTLPVQIDGGF